MLFIGKVPNTHLDFLFLRAFLTQHILLKDLIKRYKIGFDILSAPTSYIKEREDYFYQVDILGNGKVIYE